MDTVTHSLVGAAISDCWFRRRLGPVATPFALAAAALPDIDMVAFLMGPQTAWAQHRGYTHSFFVMLLAVPLIGYAGYRLSKREGSWALWSVLTALCLFSHAILDLVTSWGTMPWLPFSNARVSWDVAPVSDLFVLALSAASFVANRILRFERIDYFLNPLKYPVVHRHPRRQRAGDWVGKTAVVLISLYLLIGWRQNRQTVRLAREELAKAGVTAMEVRALPVMFTYIAWHIAARDADGAVYNAVYSSYAPLPMRFTVYRAGHGELVERVLATPEGRMFAWYAQGMFVADADAEPDGAWRVRLSDRRFFGLTRPDKSRFVMEFTESATRRGMTVAIQRGAGGIDIRKELEALWELMLQGTVTPGEN